MGGRRDKVRKKEVAKQMVQSEDDDDGSYDNVE